MFVTEVQMASRKRAYSNYNDGSSVKKYRSSQNLRGRVAKLYKKPYSARFSSGSGGASELKFFDTAISFMVDATGEVPATGQLVLIPQGVTESTRVGRSCVIKSLYFKGVVTFAPAASANSLTNVYIYFVQDTQANGAAAAVTDVMTGSNLSTALINLDNSQRFRILKKFQIHLESNAGVTTAYNSTSRILEFYKKCHIPIDYSSTTGAISEIRSNNIFMLAGTDGTDDVAAVTGTVRVRFADK